MEKNYVLTHRYSKSVEVINQDCTEMYFFPVLPVNSFSKQTNLFAWLSLIVSFLFPVFCPKIAPKYQTISTVTVSLLVLVGFISAGWFGRSARTRLLNSYPMAPNRILPTKRYLKSLKLDLLPMAAISSVVLIGIPYILIRIFLKAPSLSATIQLNRKTVFTLTLFPTLLYFLLTGVVVSLSNFLAVRRYERINADRLPQKGNIDFPQSFPSSRLPSSSLPLPEYIRRLKFEKTIGGYRIEDIDAYLDELRNKMEHDEPVYPESVRKKTFRHASIIKPGYNIPGVDAALDAIAKRLEDENE